MLESIILKDIKEIKRIETINKISLDNIIFNNMINYKS